MKLLFTFGNWHSLAKLRLHTDKTLDLLDVKTALIGKELRAFVNKTCSAFDTRELAQEAQARKRRKVKKAGAGGAGAPQAPAPEDDTVVQDEPVSKKFNINTYKMHSLGDYGNTIRRLGTTDSYSTVVVSINPAPEVGHSLTSALLISQGELEHRRPKARFSRTDKKKYIKQMTRIEQREMRLRRIQAKLRKTGKVIDVNDSKRRLLSCHHHIGISQKHYEHIGTFLWKNAGDPAIQV